MKPHKNDDNDSNCLVCRYYSLGKVMRYLSKERKIIKKHLKEKGYSLTQLKKEDKEELEK